MSVTLHTTSGDIKIELYVDDAPKACEVNPNITILLLFCTEKINVQNFLALCASDYYNGCIFHRNIKDFMVQTGDPTHSGKGGESIWGGQFEDEFVSALKHDTRGCVSMANNGPDTNRSQFFITYAKQAHLDMKYTLFGKVIDGFDTLEELETIKVDSKYRPLVQQKIQSVTIHANPLATDG